MAWRFDKQPNGLYARFSEVVDNFTHYNLTFEEAVEVCTEEFDMGKVSATQKVQRADEAPERWQEDLDTLVFYHGEQERDKFLKVVNDGN